jgi:hypothetical protein
MLNQDPDVAGRPSLASSYTGVEASLHLAEQAISEHKPIDGFLGEQARPCIAGGTVPQ